MWDPIEVLRIFFIDFLELIYIPDLVIFHLWTVSGKWSFWRIHEPLPQLLNLDFGPSF